MQIGSEEVTRSENAVPVQLVSFMPVLAQGVGSLLVVAFQNLATGIILSTKSYILRTVILGCFFFLLLPLGKLLMIKFGLLNLSPAIVSRAGHGHGTSSDPYETPVMQTTHGFLETLLWEMYVAAEGFFDYDEIDDYLYT